MLNIMLVRIILSVMIISSVKCTNKATNTFSTLVMYMLVLHKLNLAQSSHRI